VNGPECAVPLEKEIKDIFDIIFQGSFIQNALSWADTTKATDKAFVCTYLQLL